jgi:pimeloyl-ACP methyl ester carboxylesterase
MTSNRDQFIGLKDGRKLAYTEYGDPQGKPTFYFHGHPGSRLDLALFDQAILQNSGLRIIAIDRPGIGLSDFQPGRKLIDWPADVTEFMDGMGLDRVSVIGMSGGGPFAAVCAHHLPDRLHAAVILSGLGRFDLPGATNGIGSGLQYFRMARYLPVLARFQMFMMGYGVKSGPDQMLKQVTAEMPPADREMFGVKAFSDAFLATTAESLRQGAGKLAWEGGFYFRPWGFDLKEIRIPVYLWHGEADRDAPVAMGRQVAAAIPGCQATFIPDEGHFSMAAHHLAEILNPLTAC